jgi:lysophospholipase L1-like esterase
MKQKLWIIYLNLSFFCVLLVGLELAGQLAFLAWKGYPLYESGRHEVAQAHAQLFELHPFLVARLKAGVNVRRGAEVVTTTPMHTRWTGAPSDASHAFRIAVVGGSTTFGSGVTDADTWPARLQAILGPGYAVTNYGLPGYSTAEGIIQMALLVPETQPDVVILFEGWNDLHNYHDSALGPDYYSHGIRQYANLAIQPPQPPTLMARLAGTSAICHLAFVISKSLAPKTVPGARPPEPAGALPEPGPDPFVDRIFLRNLRTLKLLAQQTGAFVLFVPQVLDLPRFTGDSSFPWTPRIRNDAMPGLLPRYDSIYGVVCPPRQAGCAVVDEVRAQPWEARDFIDEGHFSPSGNEAFAILLAARIKAIAGQRAARPAPAIP